MNIIKILSIFHLASANHFIKLPSPRWLQICKSSNSTTWYYNKSKNLSSYLKENLDTLYM